MAATITADPDQTSDATRRSADTPSTGDRSTRGSALPRLRARMLLLAMLALCAFVAFREISQRVEDRSRLGLTAVTLYTAPTDVVAPGTATVLAVDVVPQERVELGQRLAVIETEERVGGWPQRRSVTLVAPHAGVVLDAPGPVGSRVGPTESVIRLYDPSKLVFRVPASFGLLSQTRIGMLAVLEFPSVGEIEATFTRVEPRIDVSVDAPDETRAFLILEPTDPVDVDNLIPGLTMSGYLQADSVDDSAPTGVQSGGISS